jgi:pSer/pThr/pTyr-binding forkhead associated (FHA) protein
MALWHLEGSLDETGTIKKIPLTHFPFIIGRSKLIDMVVLRSGISREHAEILNKDGRLFIRDLQSTNGTFVNKKLISSDTLLTHNTVIHFAQFDFKLIDSEYKAPADEMLTVIMNAEVAPGYQDKSSKKHDRRRSISALESTAKANYFNKEKPEKSVNVPEVESIEQGVSPESKVGPAPQNDHDDEKVFIQGQWDDANRRMNSRREMRWPALVTLKNQQSIPCMTKEFSAEGLSLKSPVNLQNKALIKVDINAFYKGRNEKITALGVVRHSSVTTGGFTIGIQIKSCTKSSSDFISKLSNREI